MSVTFLLASGCASTAIAPPPPLDAGRVARARARDPALADEVALLQWEARARAQAGDEAGAERRVRLAQRLLASALASPAQCPEPAAADAAPSIPAPAPSPVPPRRRKRRPSGSAVETSGRPPAGPESSGRPQSTPQAELQSLAEGLQAFSPETLEPTDRVRLAAARQALVDAQEALVADAPERARLYLERARRLLAVLSGEPEAATAAPRASSAFASDLLRSLPDARPQGASFFVSLGAAAGQPERDRLRAIGRLLRVYARASLCVGGERSPEARLTAAVRYLERTERLGARVARCAEETRAPAYVRLYPGRGERG